MPRYVHSAAYSSRGFTLVEIVVAAAILAAAAGAVVAIYVRAVEQTASARDLSVAASVARNALAEARAGLVTGENLHFEIPERPGLTLSISLPFYTGEEVPLFDTYEARVDRYFPPGSVIELTAKKAVYLYSLDEEDTPESDDEGDSP